MLKLVIGLLTVVALIAFLAALRYLPFLISQDFGMGFFVGGLVFGSVVALGSHIEMKEKLREQLDQLTGGRTDRR